MSGSKEKTRKGNPLHTTAVVVNYASHLVSSATVDMTTRKCSLLSCHLVSFVTAYGHPASVVSVSAPHLGITATHLVCLKEGMFRFSRTSRELRFVWTINDNAVSKFLPLGAAPIYSLLLDRCTNAAPKRCRLLVTPLLNVA